MLNKAIIPLRRQKMATNTLPPIDEEQARVIAEASRQIQKMDVPSLQQQAEADRWIKDHPEYQGTLREMQTLAVVLLSSTIYGISDYGEGRNPRH
jgi:hypothetical protein